MSNQISQADQKALEELLATVDDLFHAGQFAVVDKMLNDFDLVKASPLLIVGLLTASSHARGHLPSRPAFVFRAELTLTDKVGPARTCVLLQFRR